jgi:hypothetical protein
MSQPQDLPTYIRQADFEQQQPFFDLFFAIIQIWFNSNGFYLPTLTNAQVTARNALLSSPYPIMLWYNSDVDALQWLNPAGTVKTVTST